MKVCLRSGHADGDGDIRLFVRFEVLFRMGLRYERLPSHICLMDFSFGWAYDDFMDFLGRSMLTFQQWGDRQQELLQYPRPPRVRLLSTSTVPDSWKRRLPSSCVHSGKKSRGPIVEEGRRKL
jgi:hypothetical protein